MAEQQPLYIHPFEIVLNAFLYFSGSEMDEESLVRVCLTANCPSRDTALRILQQMVFKNLLTKSVNAEGLIMYAPVKKKSSNHPFSLN